MAVTDSPNSPDERTDADLQFDSQGRLRHLLTLDQMPRHIIEALLERAAALLREPGEPVARSAALDGKTVGTLFFEASTRTRASFEIASRRLGGDVLNLDLRSSSQQKGESVLDTFFTLRAMHVDIFVVRTGETGVPGEFARHAGDHVAVLNAGEAAVSHPTQGLLDALTIQLHKSRFDNLTVAIVGDVLHSRVTRSAVHVLDALGTPDIRLVCPESLALRGPSRSLRR